MPNYVHVINRCDNDFFSNKFYYDQHMYFYYALHNLIRFQVFCNRLFESNGPHIKGTVPFS